jgi:hypothetical protein
MNGKSYIRIFFGLVILLIVAAFALIVYASTTSSVTDKSNSVSQAGSNAVQVTVPTSPTSMSVPTASPTPATFEVLVGQPYPRAYSQPPARIKVVRTAASPLVSQEIALRSLLGQQNISNAQILSANKMEADGKSISFTATYGLVTVGERGTDGKWSGLENIGLANCTPDGKCSSTVEVLDHIENRLMWVFDFEISLPSSAPRWTPTNCQPNISCTVPPSPNHSVVLVDAKTLQYIGGTSYYQ